MHTDLENLENLELSEFGQAPKSQGIVKESHQRSGNFILSQGIFSLLGLGCCFVFVLIFCLLDHDNEDSKAKFHMKKSRHFDLDFFRNCPEKPGIAREFYSIKRVGTLPRYPLVQKCLAKVATFSSLMDDSATSGCLVTSQLFTVIFCSRYFVVS